MRRISLALLPIEWLSHRARGGAISPCGRIGSEPAPSSPSAPSTPASATIAGGQVHGTVKAGNIPLPGVSIVATNTLTGQRYATITDINGNYSMTIPTSGRYVLKTELAAFAPETKSVLLKPTGTTPLNQQADFALTLASRVPPESPQENVARNPGQGGPGAQAGGQGGGSRQAGTVRRNNAAGAQSLALLAQLAGTEDAGVNTGATGAALPSMANNTDFSSESVAVTGQAGTTNPFAGVDMEQLRQNAEMDPSLGGQGGFGGREVRVVLAAEDLAEVDPVAVAVVLAEVVEGLAAAEEVVEVAAAAVAEVVGGFGGGGFGNFRNFKPNQPHGAFFWTGGNSALNATPFPIRGGNRSSSPATRKISLALRSWANPTFPS